MADKNFIAGGAREVNGQYGQFFNLRINLKSINRLPQDDEGYVNITMSKIKEPKEKGYTHYLVENDYQSKKKKKQDEQAKKVDGDLSF